MACLLAGHKPIVDEASGIVKDVAIMTVGPAKGWGFWCDATTIQQLFTLMKAKKSGIKSRFKHPYSPDGKPLDDLGTLVGEVVNPRIVGDAVRGDAKLGSFAETMPGLGDVRTYLLKVAQESPQELGMSAIIDYHTVDPDPNDTNNPGLPVARIDAVRAVDWVSEPAANPRGLLSANTPAAGVGDESSVMSPELFEILVDDFGMNPKATMEEAEAFYGGLSIYDQQNALDAVLDMTDKETPMPEATLKRLKPHQKDLHKALKAKLLATAAEHGVRLSDGDADLMARKMALTKKPDEQNTTGSPAAAAEPPSAPAGEPSPAPKPAEAPAGDPEDPEDPEDGEGDDDDEDDDAALSARRDTRLIERERTRVANLAALGRVLDVPKQIVDDSVRKGHNVKTARTAYLAHIAGAAKPLESVSVGPDNRHAMLRAAIPDAICLRAGGNIEKPHPMAQQMRYMSLMGLCRAYLGAAGITGMDYMRDSEIVGLAVSTRELTRKIGAIKTAMLAESVGDFPGLLLDAMNKQFQGIYRVAAPTWQKWASKGTSKDFKNINRPLMSDLPAMQTRAPGQPINYVALTDSNEVYALSEYAQGVVLTRRAIINDDMSVFTEIPTTQTQNCIRLEEQIAYNALTAASNMSDGNALFCAAHNNLTASGSGSAPSQTSLNQGWQAIRKQTGPNGSILDLIPKFLLTPVALEQTAKNAMQSETLISLVATTAGAPQLQGSKNMFEGLFEVIATPYLDLASSTAWYMACDPKQGQIKTIEVSFLEGEESPVIKQETDFDTDDMKLAVRHTVAAKALNWRGLYQNYGA